MKDVSAAPLTVLEREQLLKLARTLNFLKPKHKWCELPLPVRIERGERLPLSFAQQRLWYLAQMEGVSETYHIPFGLHLSGILDAIVLRRALDRLLVRHEALRTTFMVVDEELVQQIATQEDSRFHLLEHDLRQHMDAKG